MEEEDSGEEKGGAPLWMATFADMMSLLLAFFVLLFSFASMDDQIYKEIGGSMKDAFGVQRRQLLTDPVLGINHIATEFSSGKPDPKVLNVVPDENLEYNVEDSSSEVETPEANDSQSDGKADGKSNSDSKETSKSETAVKKIESDTAADAKAENQATKNADIDAKSEKEAESQANNKSDGDAAGKTAEAKEADKTGQAIGEAKGLTEQNEAAVSSESHENAVAQFAALKAKKLGDELAQEIANGDMAVETAGNKVIIRVNEDASFPPGASENYSQFAGVIEKISKVVKDSPGKVIVEGHTDNIPIQSTKYRSNWELSAARAVTVVHGLINQTGLPVDRFQVRGMADSMPIATNRTAKGRAKNRRVEVILEYDSKDLVPEEFEDQVEPTEEEKKALEKQAEAPEDPTQKLYNGFNKTLGESNLESGEQPTEDQEFNLIFRDDFFR